LWGEGLFPEVAVVVFGEGGTFHGDGGYGGKLAQVVEVFLEAIEGILVVAFAGGEVVVVIADFVTEANYLFYDCFVAGFTEKAEVVAAFDAQTVLDFGHTEGVGVA